MLLTLNIHYTRASDIVVTDHIITNPPVPITAYRDSFGNWCSRIVAPPGEMRISTHAIINDSGLPNQVDTRAMQHPAEDLPAETLMFLLGSRYCETDRLSETAWALFGDAPPGGSRVQAICDFVHAHTTFGYQHARVTLGISGFPLRRTRWIFPPGSRRTSGDAGIPSIHVTACRGSAMC
jgi:transglutaminase-like putative cysteine protease